MKITKVEVKKFRNLEDISFRVGKKVTAIAGQNGTSKTALLGMISHIFNFSSNFRTLTGAPFYAMYSEIFRFSYPNYDKAGQHIYTIHFNDHSSVNVNSYDRTKNKKPINLRLRVGKSSRGRGKTKMPVIYLGMKRLFPFAQEAKITKDVQAKLSEEEAKFYKNSHNAILLMNEEVETDRIVTKNKDYFAPRTKRYDHLGISAGQDNIGQIITAVLSFKKLKEQQSTNYQGGFIFIDEVDASLYPGAQLKLVEFLFKMASELDLQIFFTTHSLEILEAVSKCTPNNDGAVIYLDKNRNKITPKINLNISKIRNDLKVLGPEFLSLSKEKKYFYLEDGVAKSFAKNIIDNKIKKTIILNAANLGEGLLQAVAKAKLPAFKTSYFLLDGDVTIRDGTDNVLKLPGGKPPELVAFEYLRSLSRDDEFWEDSQLGYTSQFCFKDCDDASDKNKLKNWFGTQTRYWGKNASKLWKRWKEDNVDLVKKFNSNLESYLA